MKVKKRKIKKQVWILAAIIIIAIFILVMIVKSVQRKNSDQYKFAKLGYKEEEITSLLKEEDKEKRKAYLALPYNSLLPKLMSEKYYLYEHLNDYLAYAKKQTKLSTSELISLVNVGANEDWYDHTKKSDVKKENLILVNKFYGLEKEYKPTDLVSMSVQYAYANNFIREEANDAFAEMWYDATEENLSLIANSAYRSYASQEASYTYYKNELGTAAADKTAARPGHSEHQTGLCLDIDIYRKYEGDYDQTDEFKWLKKNAHKYGFIMRYPKGQENITGYAYEPWHYRYVGVKVATEIYNKGITFDEYYAYYLK